MCKPKLYLMFASCLPLAYAEVYKQTKGMKLAIVDVYNTMYVHDTNNIKFKMQLYVGGAILEGMHQ